MQHPTNNRRQFLIAGLTTIAATATPTWALSAEPTKLKIGVVGSGRVGSSLGGAWVKAGHQVMFSSTNIENDQKLAATLGANAKAGTPREAAAFGDVLLIAVPFSAMTAVSKELEGLLKDKIVIDTVNASETRDGAIAKEALEKGVGNAMAELLPGAYTVRAFNAIQAARMGMGLQNATRVGVPISGQNAAAISTVSALIAEIGFEPVVVSWSLSGYLRPGTALTGEKSPEEIREAVRTLK
ncbi:MAG: NAD(P)-binding domain-containing protein [Steroidobacteraceae bacterium]